jgi:hypothetical protein
MDFAVNALLTVHVGVLNAPHLLIACRSTGAKRTGRMMDYGIRYWSR